MSSPLGGSVDAMFNLHQARSSVYTLVRYMQSTPLDQLDGRSPVVPVGNLLGGSSSINFMMYNNAAASDFDDWEAPGWSFDELKPFIAKSERWDVPKEKDSIHGREGRMPVSSGGHQSSFSAEYFRAFKKVKNLPFVEDLVDFRTAHGCGFLPKLISSRDGTRSNTAKAYLIDPGHLSEGSNVRLMSNQTVVRVLFDGTRAIGLETCETPSGPLADADYRTRLQRIKANKLVILASGAFGSPMILERSGIGDPKLLHDLGVELIADVPGVGAEYQDHELTICSYCVSGEAETLDDYARGTNGAREKADAEWEKTGKGVTATNGFDFGFKIRPTEEDLKDLGPEFTAHWEKVAGDKPDKPLYSGPLVNYFMGPTPRPETGKYFSMGAFLNYPAGRGSVHITSSDFFAPARFDAGLLSHPADLAPHVWAYKFQREVARRMPFYLGEYAPSHPNFSPDSGAAIEDLKAPRKPESVQSLVYTKEDNRAIETWVRRTVGTAYHSISTCQMRPKELGGVVDARLNVYGAQGLKVADLSICPSNLGTNTTTVALIIGEKAAGIFEEDLEAERQRA